MVESVAALFYASHRMERKRWTYDTLGMNIWKEADRSIPLSIPTRFFSHWTIPLLSNFIMMSWYVTVKPALGHIYHSGRALWKMVTDFPAPSGDVNILIISRQGEFGLVTSRQGTGKSLTCFTVWAVKKCFFFLFMHLYINISLVSNIKFEVSK